MDAVCYVKEKNRMCEAIHEAGGCEECPLASPDYDYACADFISDNPEKVVSIVEKWAKEHPMITNADKFREVFGTPPYSYSDLTTLYICPPVAVQEGLCRNQGDCERCAKWRESEYK